MLEMEGRGVPGAARPRWPGWIQGIPFAALALLGALACGGGGGSPSGSDPAASIDSDPTASPAPDPAYHGVPSTPLGALLTGSTVTFTYWNPSASTVSLCLYANWNDALNAAAATVPMTRGAGGVWSSGSIPIPAQNYYVFNVGGAHVLDPYARSMAQWMHAGTNVIAGDSIGKGAILDPSAIAPDGGWTAYAGTSYYFDGSGMKGPDGSAAPYAYGSNRDAIIYEAGVRDLTVDPALAGFAAGHPWGTFKGLIDLLPHIQKLGVTHLQLLCPLQNYHYDQTRNTQRELNMAQTSGANYNWGYDPQNYFTPSGMYSAAPDDPGARVNELKTLVNEIHRQGMGVILDVVYNHTANNDVLCDAGLQDYYYRSSSRNGAGSQDVRSEAKMVRKLIVDSILQWVEVYHVDGFRFDLMGVLDTQTIQAAYAAASAINPRVLFLGEGWTGFYTGATTDYNQNPTAGCDQSNASQFLGKNVSLFSDSYRQIFKNGYPSDGSPAFLSRLAQSSAALFSNVSGVPTNAFAPGSANNVVDYLTCHDNLCLYDALSLATNAAKADDAAILQRAKVGHAILLTSQGVAFLHAGDEMFRTKETTAASGAPNTRSSDARTFVDNSYNASDAINMVRWATVYTGDPIANGFANYATTQNGYQLYRYTQGLISLRKSTNAFRLPDAASANLAFLLPAGAGASTLAFGYTAVSTDGTGTYFVFHNADGVPHTFPVASDLRTATLLVDGAAAGVTAIVGSTSVTLGADGKTVTLAPLSSAVFKQ